MRTEHSASETPEPPRQGIPKEASRLEMMRPQRRMSVEERVRLFERLSRDAAWIVRSAKRVR